MKKDLDFGRMLGRHEAFCVVAARCTAADAVALQDIRNNKLYRGHAASWGECCSKLLHTTKTTANRLIQYLEELGPDYFEVAQFTRISPATYRAIAPAVREGKIHHDGEAIALIPENAPRVAAAIAEMRKTITIEPEPEPAPAAEPEEAPMDRVKRKCCDVVLEIQRAVEQRADATDLRRAVLYLRARLVELERTF
jgi:hypothetical protein